MNGKEETLADVIEFKKSRQDYYTIQCGLNTERECFEAIEALGAKLYQLQRDVRQAIKNGIDPESDGFKSLLVSGETLHRMQEQVVNDVCARFEVIHPKLENPEDVKKFSDPEVLKHKRFYWDWYAEQYQKYYGRPMPDLVR